jgi:hypothetical protein
MRGVCPQLGANGIKILSIYSKSLKYRYNLNSVPVFLSVGFILATIERIYIKLAEIPGVARDSRKSERIRVICLSPGSE